MSATTIRFASFAGVDLHKQTVTLRSVDPQGQPISALTCDTKCVDRIRAWMLALPRPSHLAVEAVGFVEWFIDRFRECVDKMDIADATGGPPVAGLLDEVEASTRRAAALYAQIRNFTS